MEKKSSVVNKLDSSRGHVAFKPQSELKQTARVSTIPVRLCCRFKTGIGKAKYIENRKLNECLTTPQHRNKLAVGCQTNGIYILLKSNKYILKIHKAINRCAKFVYY